MDLLLNICLYLYDFKIKQFSSNAYLIDQQVYFSFIVVKQLCVCCGGGV